MRKLKLIIVIWIKHGIVNYLNNIQVIICVYLKNSITGNH